MSAQQQKNLSESAQVDQQSVKPFPRSQKVYVQGSRPDIRVPMREIGTRSMQLLLGALTEPGAASESILLPTTVVERDSA